MLKQILLSRTPYNLLSSEKIYSLVIESSQNQK